MTTALAKIVEPDQDWSDFSIGSLVDHAMSRHIPARLVVPVLLERARRTESAEVVPLSILVVELAAELLTHIWQEEHVLFPYLRGLDSSAPLPEPVFGGVQNPVAVMLCDHGRLLEQTERMQRITAVLSARATVAESDRDLCEIAAEFCSYLTEHVRFENDILFPRALEMVRRHRSVQRHTRG